MLSLPCPSLALLPHTSLALSTLFHGSLTHTPLPTHPFFTGPLPPVLSEHASLALLHLSVLCSPAHPFAFKHTHSFPSTPCSALSRLPHTFLAFSSHVLFLRGSHTHIPGPPHLSAGPFEGVCRCADGMPQPQPKPQPKALFVPFHRNACFLHRGNTIRDYFLSRRYTSLYHIPSLLDLFLPWCPNTHP